MSESQSMPLPRVPWTLRLAGCCWVAAGVVFALTPLLAALLLRSQYVSLRGRAFGLAGLADTLAPEEFVRLEPYLDDFERIEAVVADATGWAILPLALVYLGFVCIVLLCYLPLGIATARGAHWARVVGTVLAALGSLVVFTLWQAIAAFSWLPVTALSANHLGLVLIALHLAGVVLVWLPASNAHARARAATRARAAGIAAHLHPQAASAPHPQLQPHEQPQPTSAPPPPLG